MKQLDSDYTQYASDPHHHKHTLYYHLCINTVVSLYEINKDLSKWMKNTNIKLINTVLPTTKKLHYCLAFIPSTTIIQYPTITKRTR